MPFFQTLITISTLATATLAYVVPHTLLGRQAPSDTCANLDQPIVYNINGQDTTAPPPNQCLCLSGVPDFVDQSTYAAFLRLLGATDAEITTGTNNGILVAPSSAVCTYPDNSTPGCTEAEPCAFTCNPGFTLVNGQCVCPDGQVDCGDFCAAQCPSTVPRKRSAILGEAASSCPAGYTVCGVFGGRDTWECLNTKSDLESCGGCVIPFMHGAATGTDCSALPGVSDVSCEDGACVVHSCLSEHWTLNDDLTACLPVLTLVEQ